MNNSHNHPYPPSYDQSINNSAYPPLPPNNPHYHPNNPGYTPNNPGYPPNNPGYPPNNPGYPPNNPGYPTHNPGYPPNNPGYPPTDLGYPSPDPSLPPANSSLPSKMGFTTDNNPGYPAGGAAPPAQVPLTTVQNSSIHFVPQQNFTPSAQTTPLGPQPSTVVCPRCGDTVTTAVRAHPSLVAWMACGIMAILGCFCGCCLIPFCVQQLRVVHHSCPKCKTYLGKYSRLN